jgi:hypothetical protein
MSGSALARRNAELTQGAFYMSHYSEIYPTLLISSSPLQEVLPPALWPAAPQPSAVLREVLLLLPGPPARPEAAP